MFLSIIIPVFKVEQYIDNCIRSVIVQQNVNFEVILVDDCSPDDSARIACDLLSIANIDYQYIRHEVNKGLSAARNSGIRVAKGEYVYFLDSDDELIGENALSLLVAAAKKSKADCVVGNYVYDYGNGHHVPAKYRYEYHFDTSESISAFSATKVPVTAWNKLMKKSFIIENSLYFCEGVVNEDQLWGFVMALHRSSVFMTGESTYLYKVRSGSIMTRDSEVKIKDACRVYDIMVSYYLENKPYSKSDDKSLARYLDYFSWLLYKLLSQSKFPRCERSGIYKKIRQVQRRYRGYGIIRYLRSVHIFLPQKIGEFFCYIVMKKLTKQI